MHRTSAKQLSLPDPRICSRCGQPLRNEVLPGIYLPPLKAELVFSIKAAGDIGISTHELLIMHYGQKPVKPETVKAHIWQLNDEWLDLSPWYIASEGSGRNRRWFLGRRKEQQEYDRDKDFGGSINECSRAIRERVKAGDPGWADWPSTPPTSQE